MFSKRKLRTNNRLQSFQLPIGVTISITKIFHGNFFDIVLWFDKMDDHTHFTGPVYDMYQKLCYIAVWSFGFDLHAFHYDDVIMGAIASLITSLTIVYSTVYSDADQRKHHNFASLAFMWGIHRRPVNSPHKWPVTRKMFPFDDVIMRTSR